MTESVNWIDPLRIIYPRSNNFVTVFINSDKEAGPCVHRGGISLDVNDFLLYYFELTKPLRFGSSLLKQLPKAVKEMFHETHASNAPDLPTGFGRK